MRIANESFLKPLIEKLNKYTARDKKYTIAAVTKTISKFGPSGSLKSTNIALEQIIEVMPKIINEILFDLKYMSVIILENLKVDDQE
jgi:hypothetical protein